MNENKLSARLLKVLFRRAQDNVIINIFDLAESCGQSVFAALKGLAELQKRGLVDARRLRLTLDGLAVASALAGARHAPDGEGRAPERERKSERCPPRSHAA